MPRTKAVKKKLKLSQVLTPMLENKRKSVNVGLEKHLEDVIGALHSQLLLSKLSLPRNVASKTIGELSELPLNWSGNSTSANVLEVVNATKTMTAKKKTISRSSSCGDEGYLTAESSKSTSGGRRSRARSRLLKAPNNSRSASNSTRSSTISISKFKTPANRIPPSTYGTVTPKMKPNTPQVLLRRPKLGEVALSMQGSPLLTGAVSADNVANINIPLNDGRMLSIQPQRGLRISQIPDLDLETKRQLETLRDNLNKVCALSGTR